MTQQTWLGSDLVSEVLLQDIPDNETELYLKVGVLEVELENAKDGEDTLLAKEQAQDAATNSVTTEVENARDGFITLLTKEQAQDAATNSVTTEVENARDGFITLLAKQQDQDAKIADAQQLVTFNYPDQTGKQNYSLTTDGILPYWKDFRTAVILSYDDRGTLRGMFPDDKDLVIVEGLGLFVFSLGSDEPDDDELCFATSTGRWLSESLHLDAVDAFILPEAEIVHAEKIFSTITCTITSVNTVTSTAFSGTIKGVMPGDKVITSPPAALGATAADTGKLSFHAFVSAKDTVSIYLCNASAASATTNTSIRTAWPVLIIKEI